MRPVSANFLSALRGPHTPEIRVTATRGGQSVGDLPSLRVLSGQVTFESARTSSPRRSLSLELVPEKGLWDALAPAGTVLQVWRGVRFVDGTSELVPLGTFDVDEQSLSYSPGGGLSITAPDLWERVRRARFETPRTTTGGALTSAVNLAVEATGTTTGELGGDFTATHRRAVWERERDDAVTELARAAGAWVYADVDGNITTRDVPYLKQVPVWMVDASASGVMLDATRSRNRQRTYNVVIVSAGDIDGTTPFAPVVTADTDPLSPTWVDGPFGRVPFFYSSQLITTSAQAAFVGRALLRRTRGLAAQLELTSIVNPALEPGDVLEVLLPARDGDRLRVERHLLDSGSIPLAAEGTQSLQTRSTRPEGDVPAEA